MNRGEEREPSLDTLGRAIAHPDVEVCRGIMRRHLAARARARRRTPLFLLAAAMVLLGLSSVLYPDLGLTHGLVVWLASLGLTLAVSAALLGRSASLRVVRAVAGSYVPCILLAWFVPSPFSSALNGAAGIAVAGLVEAGWALEDRRLAGVREKLEAYERRRAGVTPSSCAPKPK